MSAKSDRFVVRHYGETEAKLFGDDAPGVKIRILLDETNGAPVYVLRMIEIEPGGSTPLHSHDFEHENFILSGKGAVLIGENWHDVGEGYVVLVPSGVRHQYRNDAGEPFVFLCGIPVEKLRA
ncbi:MAG: cupin domain-containing protein [Actinomycetota bacterium]|nr:cupin domain-containing protein [Actinomycetota bacterium]